MRYGGIEAGGTKWACAVGDGRGRLLATETFATTTPEETIPRAVEFFMRNGSLGALGIGTFGPIDIDRSSPTWGHITTTPKPGWTSTDIVSPLQSSLEVPVALDTDVNVAALGEWRWGSAVRLDTFCYITVGTGIGGGVVANGQLLHGLSHPELGHMRIPHDRARDPFDGSCPYHGDCLEGLASGESIRERWGRAGEDIASSTVWELEAEYLALALVNVICALSPQRIVLGGGVAKQPNLLPLVRRRLEPLLSGYLGTPALASGLADYVVAPGLGEHAGVHGAIELARASAAGPRISA